MFAVMGATGKAGGAVARTLLAKGRPVRVVLRDPGKGTSWAERRAEIAVADSSDAISLSQAFTAVEGAFVMLPPILDPSPGFPEAKALIAALAASLSEAGPQKVVVLSTIGADAAEPNLLNQPGMLEQALAPLPMPVSFLRPAWFMENSAWDVRPARQSGVIDSYLQPLDKTFPMVATEGVGRTAVALLLETWSGHRVIELEGPSRVSPDALAMALAKALSRPVTANIVPSASWDGLFRTQGMRHPESRIQMLDGFNAGWIAFSGAEADRRPGKISIAEASAALTRQEQGDSHA